MLPYENIVFDYLIKHLAPEQLPSRYLIWRMFFLISAHIFSNSVFKLVIYRLGGRNKKHR